MRPSLSCLSILIAASLAVLAGCSNGLLDEARGLQAKAASPRIAVSKSDGSSVAAGASLDFGSMSVGKTASLSLTLANGGKNDLVIAASGISLAPDSGTAAGVFAISRELPLTIAAGGAASLSVSFTPSAAQSYGATLSIASNDIAQPSYSIKLSGTGSATAKAFTAFGIQSPVATGSIDEANKTIAVALPYGTKTTSLIATFATSGVKVMVGSAIQLSGQTQNDFSNSVAYTVYAQDGSSADYSVTVSVPTSSVSIGTQSTPIAAGIGGTATFAVTSIGIPDATAGTLTWYTSSDGKTPTTAPSGVTATLGPLSSNAATIGITSASSVTAGSYYFAIAYGTAISPITTLSIAQATVSVGSQSGSVTAGATASVSFPVTTSNIADGAIGTFAWYSSSSGGSTITAPSSITASVTAVASGQATITMTPSSTWVAGSYYFALLEGSVVSAVIPFGVICPAPTALATVGSNGSVALTWTACSGASGYTVYRSTASGTKGSSIGTSASASFTDASGANNTSYYYEVAATNAGGESTASTQVWGLPHILPTMKNVAGGTFQRDSTASNVSKVYYGSSFNMSAHLVTGALYAAVTGLADPSYSSHSATDHPVDGVSWYSAIAFCNRLSIAEGKTPVYTISSSTDPSSWGSIPTSSNATWNAVTANLAANGYRLPTEMEYLWAAMGGASDYIAADVSGTTNTGGYLKGYAGSSESGGGKANISNYTWNSTNSDSISHTVGTKLPNEFGIYDLSGNLWEWCWDWYASFPTGGQIDYQGPSTGTQRMYRGGSYANNPSASALPFALSYRALYDSPHLSYITLGFRVVTK